MVKEIFSNVSGVYVLSNGRVIDSYEYSSATDVVKREGYEKKFLGKFKVVKELTKKVQPEIPVARLREINISVTKKQISDSIGKDEIVIQVVNNIDDLTRMHNRLVARLREWYSLSLPELSEQISSNETFVELVLTKDKKELMSDLKLTETMGTNLGKDDLKMMKALAQEAQNIQKLRELDEKYLSGMLKDYAPNLTEVATPVIAAQLIRHCGSLGKLSRMPSSTIQLLGAEKALFRHLKMKARCPKQGLIINHPYLANAKMKDRGKIARHLTGTLSICAKVDFFKGERDVGKKLKKQLEAKLKKEGLMR